MALFVGNDTHHGTHGEPSVDPNGGPKWVIRPTAKTIKTGPTDKHWEQHVEGKRPLGVVPITKENTASWGSIDYDVYDDDLTALIGKVEHAKLPLVPCRSKSGGLHLWLFATEPVDAKLLQDALREMAASLGIADCEIFPKQASLLTDRGDQGSWMIMPYFGGNYGGKLKMQVGLRKNGAEVSLPEFVRAAEKARQTPEEIQLLTVRSVQPKAGGKKAAGKAKKRGAADDESVPFGDGPPCLIHMTQAEGGIGQGGQNNTLFHMGVYFKKKFPDTWAEELSRANHLYMNPPHPQPGVDSVTKSLGKKDYQYKCKDEPMRSHCDAILCRRKRFGVTGSGGFVAPIINSVKKLNSDPPVWFLDVEGAKIECGTDDLQRWDRFQRLLMNKLDNPFGVIPQPVWLQIIQEAMTRMTEVIDVGPGSGMKGTLFDLMETYLTNRQRGQKEEDLLTGRPWENEEEGRHYFQVDFLMKFLQREGFKDIKKNQVIAFVKKDLEGQHVGKNIKGKFRNLFWIDSARLQKMPDVDPPKVKATPI